MDRELVKKIVSSDIFWKALEGAGYLCVLVVVRMARRLKAEQQQYMSATPSLEESFRALAEQQSSTEVRAYQPIG